MMLMSTLIAYHYPYNDKNPYQLLMFQSLSNNNIKAIGVNNGLRGLLNIVFKKSGDIIHLHWIHGPATFENAFGTLLRLSTFHFSILLWLLRGKRIVWTVHNIINHEGKRKWLDRFHAYIVALEAHKILVHGESVVPIVRHEFRVPDNKIRVVYHGNYKGVVESQPMHIDQETGVRFLCFGAIRPYKGILDLLKVFADIPGPHQLHLAGAPKNDALKDEIVEQATLDSNRVSLDLQFISDKELERLLGWSNVVVLPYKDILTSSSLLMAMTAARPVVAPRAGLIPEYIDDQAAFLYDSDDQKGLEKALERAVNCKDLTSMAKRSIERSKEYDWDSIGEKIARIYQE